MFVHERIRFYLLLSSLVENYTHIGFQKTQLNHNFRSYLLGVHSGVAVIDPHLTLFLVRKFSRVLLRLLNINQKICFVGHRLGYFLNGKTFFFRHYYSLDYWVPGILSNKRFSLLYGSNTKTLRLKRVPSILILLGLPEEKGYSIYKEGRSRGILTCALVDSDMDPGVYSYFIPTNIKSPQALHFFIEFFAILLAYFRVFQKKSFYGHVLKEKKV